MSKMLMGVVMLCVASAACAGPLELPLYPAGSPATQPLKGLEVSVERGKPEHPDRSFRNVSNPTISVYLLEKDANGAAVVICPGGGYGSLAIDKEGHDIARWLNTFGVTGIVLKYRLPHPEITLDGTPWPLLDAQRAIRLARTKASEWKIDPTRIGIMGFSAGGHLASTAGTHFDAGKLDATDMIDRQSCRPDFMILGYAVISFQEPIGHKGSRNALLGANADAKRLAYFSNELQVTAQTPPTFLVQTRDDGVKAENSIRFAEALKQAGVPYALQLYDKGGHGYGLGIHGGEVAGWPEKCKAWMESMDLLKRRD